MKLLCLAWLALCIADDVQNLRGNAKPETVAPVAAKPEEAGCGWMVERFNHVLKTLKIVDMIINIHMITHVVMHAFDHLWVPWYLF